MRLFDLTSSPAGPSPVIVEVPHAGLEVPEDVRASLGATDDAILRDADLYVDRLYAGAPAAGATLLCARLSRYVVDLNRAEDDCDRETVPDHPHPRSLSPRGIVWRLTTDGRTALRRPLRWSELTQRVARYYRPYHEALREQIAHAVERFGHALVVAGHSMPSVGRSLHSDAGARRADVVPGTCGRTSAAVRFIDAVDAHFRAQGYSVLHDDPYMGGWTTRHYGRPRAGVHVVQIELNRALYMDEATCAIRQPDAARLTALLASLVRRLAALEP